MTKVSLKYKGPQVNNPIFYVCLSNRITNNPAKRNLTPLEQHIDALCRVRARQDDDATEIEFSSISEMLKLCNYSLQTHNRKQTVNALAHLEEHGNLIDRVWYEGRYRVIIEINDEELKWGREGFTKVPFPFPKKSAAGCNLWLLFYALKRRKKDTKRLCKAIGINPHQKYFYVLRDYERAVDVISEHAQSLDGKEYEKQGIELYCWIKAHHTGQTWLEAMPRSSRKRQRVETQRKNEKELVEFFKRHKKRTTEDEFEGRYFVDDD